MSKRSIQFIFFFGFFLFLFLTIPAQLSFGAYYCEFGGCSGTPGSCWRESCTSGGYCYWDEAGCLGPTYSTCVYNRRDPYSCDTFCWPQDGPYPSGCYGWYTNCDPQCSGSSGVSCTNCDETACCPTGCCDAGCRDDTGCYGVRNDDNCDDHCGSGNVRYDNGVCRSGCWCDYDTKDCDDDDFCSGVYECRRFDYECRDGDCKQQDSVCNPFCPYRIDYSCTNKCNVPDEECCFMASGFGCGTKNGRSCSFDTECCSGHCVDGVCCDRDCPGTCQACNLPGKEGICTIRIAGDITECGTCESCTGASTNCLPITADEGKGCRDDCWHCVNGECESRVAGDDAECSTCQFCDVQGGDCVGISAPDGKNCDTRCSKCQNGSCVPRNDEVECAVCYYCKTGAMGACSYKGDGADCPGSPGKCCVGACDDDGTVSGSGYHSNCRSGPFCIGWRDWGYVVANVGDLCGGINTRVCTQCSSGCDCAGDTWRCDTEDDKTCDKVCQVSGSCDCTPPACDKMDCGCCTDDYCDSCGEGACLGHFKCDTWTHSCTFTCNTENGACGNCGICIGGVCTGEGCDPGSNSPECPCHPDTCRGSSYYDYPDFGDCTPTCQCDTGTDSGEPCQPISITRNDPRCAAEIINPLRARNLWEFIEILTNLACYIAKILAPVLIIFAGYLFITSEGKPAKIIRARKLLQWAIVGFVISCILAKAIVAMIKSILGVIG